MRKEMRVRRNVRHFPHLSTQRGNLLAKRLLPSAIPMHRMVIFSMCPEPPRAQARTTSSTVTQFELLVPVMEQQLMPVMQPYPG